MGSDVVIHQPTGQASGSTDRDVLTIVVDLASPA